MPQTAGMTYSFPSYTFIPAPQSPLNPPQLWKCTVCKAENRITAKRCASCHRLQPIRHDTPRACDQVYTFALRAVFECQAAGSSPRSPLTSGEITTATLTDFEQHYTGQQQNKLYIAGPAADQGAMVLDEQPDSMAMDLVLDPAGTEQMINQIAEKMDEQPDGEPNMADEMDFRPDDMSAETPADDETLVDSETLADADAMDQE